MRSVNWLEVATHFVGRMAAVSIEAIVFGWVAASVFKWMIRNGV